MNARRMSALWLIVAAACGGGDGPAPTTPAEDTPTPLSFAAGAGLGAVVLSHHTTDPAALTTSRCELSVWLAHAAEAGRLERVDEEGACLLLASEPSPANYVPALTPACAGAFRVAYGPAASAITFCDLTSFPAPSSVDCADVAMSPSIAVTSLAGELPGDELGTLNLTAAMPTLPQITTPASQGDGTALWPDGALLLAWQGDAASSIEIVLRVRPAGATELHCFVPDTGRFELPERLVAPFRVTGASVEVLRASVVEAPTDGFDVRVSGRVGDAIWLFPAAAP